MASVYTVGQANRYIKNMFEQDFTLHDIYIKGEVSNCKYHSSGHIYFSLKDSTGVMAAIMFAGNRASGLKFRMEEGQTVIVRGNVGVYERDGKYQLYARQITLEGAGLLYQRYEQLKQQMQEMGLFDPMYKKPIPPYATRIGVCTAPEGAVIQDIRNVSHRRNPYVQIYLYPCLVQGEGAAQTIVNGIRCLDRMGLDVIIVGRGGGSIEDLWAFNEELVAQAIFDCQTPVISAVGHETDTTIADYVADLRAPTPSAAAELAVFDYQEFQGRLAYYREIFNERMLHQVRGYRNQTRLLESNLHRYSPKNQLLVKKQYTADLTSQLEDAFYTLLHLRRHSLELYAERLNGLSPLNKISKGFAYVSDVEQKPLGSVAQVNVADAITLTLQDGQVDAKVTDVRANESVSQHG